MQSGLGTRLQRRSTADEVADLLRTMVFSNELTTGDQLTESRLAPELGVSRQVVREAVFRLEADGLVERLPYRGAVVKRITRETVRELYDVRRILEAAAVDATAGRPECGTRLLDVVDAMRSAGDDWRTVINADFEFHTTLLGALGSIRLDRYYATLQGELRLCLALTNHGQYTPEHFVNSHHEIARTIEQGETVRARELLLEHLELSLSDVVTALDIRDGRTEPQA